jgi:hypothetical protein
MMLAHTIEAMVGDKPARVSCNTCKSQHSYKPNPPRTEVRSDVKRETGAGTRAARAGANRYQNLLKTKDTAAAKTYSPANKYEAGDVLDHSKFGLGVVMSVREGTKIEVRFENGLKTLVQAR